MAIAVGCDHAGYTLKLSLLKYFEQHQIEFVDVGCYSPERCDYPDYAVRAAQLVAGGECEYGVVICGSGIGVSIVSNKVKGIRAALCCDERMTQYARRHNNANVLALGGRFISPELAVKLVDLFLNTPFEQGRHRIRVSKIHSLTQR